MERVVSVPGRSYLRVTLEQNGVDLRLRLLATDDTQLLEVDGVGGLWMPELLAAELPEAGSYRLQIVSTSGYEPVPGHHASLHLDELRPWIEGDRERLVAERLLQEGLQLQKPVGADGFDRSETNLRRAVEILQRLGDASRLSTALQLLGDALAARGDVAEAATVLETAVERARQAADPQLEAGALARLGQARSQLGDTARAVATLEDSVARLGSEAPLPLRAWTTLRLAEGFHRAGEEDRAQALYEETLGFCRADCSVRDHAVALADLGALYRAQARYGEALEAYQTALTLARQIGDTFTEVLVLNNLGVLQRNRGEVQEALETYRRSLELATTVDRKEIQAAASVNLGRLFSLLGDKRQAVEALTTARQLFQEMQSPAWEGSCLLELGWLWLSNDRAAQAIEALTEARRLGASASAKQLESYASVGLARAYLANGEPEVADRLIEQVLDSPAETTGLAGRVEALKTRGTVDLELGRTAAASEAYGGALDLAQRIGDDAREASLLSAMARLARQRERPLEAESLLKRSLSLREGLRGELASPDLRSYFQATGQSDYSSLVDLLIQRSVSEQAPELAEEAFQVSERGRARSLVELLAEAEVDLEAGVDPLLRSRRGELTAQLSEAQRSLGEALAKTDSDPELVARMRQRLAELRRDLELVEGQIRRDNPRYGEIRYPEAISAEQVRSLLAPGQALLEITLGEERSHLFVVTSEGLRTYELPAGDELRRLALDFARLSRAPGRSTLGRLVEVGRALWNATLRPAEEQLRSVRHLLIVPDQELHYVPFEALLPGSGSPETASYALQTWSFSYLPSASALRSLRQRRALTHADREPTLVAFAVPEAPSTSLLGLGDQSLAALGPLPNATREVRALAALFPADRVHLFVGDAATETNLRQASQLANVVLHMAAHAVVDQRETAKTALVLHPGPQGGNDGLLQIHEVFDLSLDARLVTVSACDTALGELVRGEGLVGLSQGFFYAGADSLLLSLWPVADDSTARFMTSVYQRLLQGLPKDEAVREAKLDLLASGPLRHPFYWAPFVLSGDPSALPGTPTTDPL